SLMGEKSFDHSKKFWFNKLRKHYILEEITISEKGDVIETKEQLLDKPDKPIESPIKGVKPAGFKPRFKAAAKPTESKPADETANQSTVEDNPGEGQPPIEKTAPASKPAGFKPRFKAAAKPTESKPADETANQSPVE